MQGNDYMENAEWFDEEFFRANLNSDGEPRQGTQGGLKGSKRDEDSAHYFEMARMIATFYGSEGNTICDAGCGMGWTVRHLHNLREDAYGFDISQWASENAVTERIYRGDVRHILMNAELVGEPRPDVVFCDRVLGYLEPEHVQKALKELLAFTQRYLVLSIIQADTMPTPQELAHASPGRRCIMPATWWIGQMQQAGIWQHFDRRLTSLVRVHWQNRNHYFFDKKGA